ncbi:hypothetical protein L486_06765 [Kwoniella mangroviensis CBS 10435]|uniref:Uncharacterized protein n=1 Tax=Kwoniella mangroviensis CBS 10435 TaxID=1331196 RepID=A0A1B9IK09_9TREE|nr:hypothetical protein L486_06765 [Kwoniella mangroviensis CBS 10435]
MASLQYLSLGDEICSGACHSSRAHPSPAKSHHRYPTAYARPSYAYSATRPSIVVVDQPPVTINSVPRRRRTGKVVVKAVECTPSGRTTTRTYVEYGRKSKSKSKGVGYKYRK